MGSKRSRSGDSSAPKTSRYTIARSPSSAHAVAAAPLKLQSPTVVIPERRHSSAPSRAIASMSARSSRSFRSTCSAIHGPKESPSPNPAYTAYSRWLWALTNPGRITASG